MGISKKCCAHCGASIHHKKRASALYCSVRCRNDAQIKRRGVRIALKQRGAGRRGGRYPKDCAKCELPFKATRSDAQFCSAKCKQASKRLHDAYIEWFNQHPEMDEMARSFFAPLLSGENSRHHNGSD